MTRVGPDGPEGREGTDGFASASPSPSRPTAVVVERAPHVAAATVEDSVLVYDASTESAHLLNPTAAAIWALLDGERPPAAIVEGLAARFATDPSAIAADVHVALTDLVELGVAVAHQPGVETVEPEPTPEPVADRPTGPGHRRGAAGGVGGVHGGGPVGAGTGGPVRVELPAVPTTVGPFDALGFRFDVVAPPEVADRLGVTLGRLRAEDGTPPVAPPEHRYVVSAAPTGAHTGAGSGSGPDRYCSWFDDEVLLAGPLAAVTAQVLWHINNQAVGSTYPGLLVHASAVLGATGVVALVGHMDAGKSTLVSALVRRRLPYVTDEAVAVDAVSLSVEAYPKPIGLDPGSWPLFPELRDLAHPDVRTRWWLDVASMAGAVAVENRSRHPLAAVVFIEHVAEATTTFSTLAAPDAALALAGNLFNLADDGETGVARIVAVAEARPYRLRYGDLAEAVAQVETLTGPPPGPT